MARYRGLLRSEEEVAAEVARLQATSDRLCPVDYDPPFDEPNRLLSKQAEGKKVTLKDKRVLREHKETPVAGGAANAAKAESAAVDKKEDTATANTEPQPGVVPRVIPRLQVYGMAPYIRIIHNDD